MDLGIHLRQALDLTDPGGEDVPEPVARLVLTRMAQGGWAREPKDEALLRDGPRRDRSRGGQGPGRGRTHLNFPVPDRQAGMHVQFTFRNALPATLEMAARIRTLGEGGETCFEYANLRPQDEKWWTEVVEAIASGMVADCELRGATDDELALKIPETAYKTPYGQPAPYEREKIRKERIAAMRRNAGGWVMPLGFLTQGCERIYLEGIDQGSRAISARSQLRAFAVAIAMECGCARLQEEG